MKRKKVERKDIKKGIRLRTLQEVVDNGKRLGKR